MEKINVKNIVTQSLLLGIALLLPNSAKICTTAGRHFTGYVVENRINLKGLSNEYHLLYCNDNKLIFDKSLNDTIPWTAQISFGCDEVVLARRKSFSLRELPLYFPHTLVGGIFVNLGNDTKTSVPLIAESVSRHWIEINHRKEVIYHFPILSTPKIDSKRYHMTMDWDRFILTTESYNFNYDPRNTLRKNYDLILNILNSLVGQEGNKETVFIALSYLSDALSSVQFMGLMKKLDNLLKY
ncbi:uncharacterized protein PRCAT00001654001 [Priceomyces carsonii]|uniref:uncharacterized protein n=1 Tax=Priceomyces carsonii TaxID=28549 RepID=UPI002ED819AB|nr:unnamed protein product [Priceomyces carsonii]